MVLRNKLINCHFFCGASITRLKKSTPSKFQSSTFFFTLAANFRALRGISSRYRSPPPFCQVDSDVNHVDYDDLYMKGAVCESQKANSPYLRSFVVSHTFGLIMDEVPFEQGVRTLSVDSNDSPRPSHRLGPNIYIK